MMSKQAPHQILVSLPKSLFFLFVEVAHKARHGFPLGGQTILYLRRIGIPQGHAADHHFTGGYAQLIADDVVIMDKSSLRTSIEATCTGGQHDVLQEHAIV